MSEQTAPEALVECHSGSKYAERPIALVWEGERLEITAVPLSWHTPDGERFRVHTADGRTFELHYAERDDCWSIFQL